MPNHKRQRRTKPDRLLNPDATREQMECDVAYARFDEAARASETKWGIDRLPGLVSADLNEKWAITMANLNAATAANNPTDTRACVESGLRGLAALDAEATANGAEPADGAVWEYEIESDSGEAPFRFGIIADDRQWQALKAKRPDLEFYTMREVAIALREKIRSPLVSEVKAKFPGARVTKLKPRDKVDYANGGDLIPF